MPSQNLKAIFGAFVVSSYSPEAQKETWELLDKFGVGQVDTAFIYGESEKTLGELGAPKEFKIDTKTPGFAPGALSRDSILNGQKKSFGDLQTETVETYFLHSPDHDTPISETLDTIQELYKAGKFKRFGLSNFPPKEVQEIYDYASSKGYVLPTVYQGSYNPISRHVENDLFPVLRKLNIAFSVYSPLAGGFLVKTPEAFQGDDSALAGGRFDKSQGGVSHVYHGLYNKQPLVESLADWGAIAQKAGVTKAALAFRWLAYHSALRESEGDSIVLGSSKPSQLREGLESMRAGPLDEEIVAQIQKYWEKVKDYAPVDNFRG